MAIKESVFATGGAAATLAQQTNQSEHDITFGASALLLNNHDAVIGFNDAVTDANNIAAIDKLIRAFIQRYF